MAKNCAQVKCWLSVRAKLSDQSTGFAIRTCTRRKVARLSHSLFFDESSGLPSEGSAFQCLLFFYFARTETSREISKMIKRIQMLSGLDLTRTSFHLGNIAKQAESIISQ